MTGIISRVRGRVRARTKAFAVIATVGVAGSLAPIAVAHAAGTTVTGGRVNVYIHAITSSTGEGAVSSSALQAQMNVLNDAFLSTGWSFSLAAVDYTANDAWYSVVEGSTAEHDMKAALRRGSASDLNLYTAALTGDVAGWGALPSDYRRHAVDDGVVVRYSTLPGGSFAPFNLGDTAVHQVGHWMGLFDTSQGGCSKRNDQVADTPAERQPSFGCPTGSDTCNDAGKDPIDNFMDSTDDDCRSQFTPGQDARMDDQFSRYRWGK